MPKSCVTIFYPNTLGKRFDSDYYLVKHLPMTRQLFGTDKLELRKGLATPFNATPVYLYMLRIWISSREDFLRLMEGPAGQELIKDVPNYTDIDAVIQFDEVVPLDSR